MAEKAYQLVPNNGSPPPQGVIFGHQYDSGDMYIAVADSGWGTIPGKAQGNTCWFSYDGMEHMTYDFRWLVAPHYAVSLEKAWGGGPPHNALSLGQQRDGGGLLYLAVADTQWGKIPGRAMGDTCWFPYGGKEHPTKSFDWIVTRQ